MNCLKKTYKYCNYEKTDYFSINQFNNQTNLMKKAIALLLLVLPLFCVAQINYEPGYFIENGVRTECLIKNIAWKNNPTSFEYKLNENDEPTIKTISTVIEFNVNESYKFVRVTTNIDRSETNIDRIDNSKEPKWKKETVFLNVLIEGKINLYMYEENNFIRYFSGNGDPTQVQQLVFKEYNIDGGIAQNNYFRQQLYNQMKDTGFSISRFENLKYKKDDLVKLFTEYNGNDNTKMSNLSEKQNKSKVSLRFTPGATVTSLDISNSMSKYSFDFGSKLSYRIGAELEYVLPFNNNKWSLFVDPNYQSYENDGKNGSVNMEVSYKFIEIPVGVRHHMYLSDKSRLFANAAYIASLSIGDNYVKYGDTKLDVSNTSAIAIGMGYGYQKYSIEARYTFNHGIMDTYVSWGSNFSSLGIILGYKLF